MPSRERPGEGSRGRAASIVVPFPRRRRADPVELARLVPSGRAIVLAFGLLAAALACWWLARESSFFDVRRVQVAGAPPHVARQVERVLHDHVGTSLLELDTGRARSRLLALPTVRSVTLDRAFPNTLRVAIVPERPVAVIRQGAEAWVVSARGRVMSRVDRRARGRLPRIWVARAVRLEVGRPVQGDARAAVVAVAPIAAERLPGRVARARARPGELTLVLRSGLELRLGEPSNVRLKLRVLARVLPLLEDGTAYVDVAIPERPVSGISLNSQVEVENSTSTTT
jgi:cell division protein FtsQ